jgi:hypothetical protein
MFTQDEQEQFNKYLLRCIENLESADLPHLYKNLSLNPNR